MALEIDRAGPVVTSFQDCLATASLNFAGYLQRLGRFADAFSEFEQSRVSYDKLCILHPDSQDSRWGQAMARKSLGEVLAAQKKPAEARAMFQAAAKLYDVLVADYPQMKPIAADHDELLGELAQLNASAPAEGKN